MDIGPGPHFSPMYLAVVSRSPLRSKVLEFRAVLKDRITQRELIAFAGASASVRRNKEKSAGSAIGTREDIMLDKAPNGKVADLLNALAKALPAGAGGSARAPFSTDCYWGAPV